MSEDELSVAENITTKEKRMRRLTHFISFGVGIFLFILGLCGILSSGFAGLHMSSLYSTIICVSGIIIFYYSYINNSLNAFRACFFFGFFFGCHALAGYTLGSPGLPSLGNIAQDDKLLVLVPGLQELGTVDHFLNSILSFALFGGAIDWWIRYSTDKKNPNKEV